MALPFYNWSKTAATNATSDSTVNWAEGQAPSSVNDSARAMMASVAGYRDDIAGAIVTGGASTAYTVTSYEVFDTLAHMNGQMIAFTPHTTNGATVTLNVDSLGAKPLRSAPSTDLLAGVLIQGTPYVATYNNSDGVWYLQNFYGNPYNCPLGGGMLYFGGTVPNSAFAFGNGAAISRTTYAPFFGLVGTAYGNGDGSTTFNIPDLSGRVPAGKESVATRLTGTYFGGNSTVLGNVGGLESSTLLTANLPAYTPAGGITNGAITITGGTAGATNTTTAVSAAGHAFADVGSAIVASMGASTFAGTAQGGTSTPVRTVQPTFICNFIIRVL